MALPTAPVRHVPHAKMRAFVLDLARALEMPDDHATLLAELLVDNDLRGNLTHGSRQMLRYAREVRRGGINPRPNVTCVDETPCSFVMDGDGGLGYFPAHEGARRLIEKAQAQGAAVMVTRNHGHIGAAGIYTRMAAEADLLAFFTSGVQLRMEPGKSLVAAAGASPMSFGVPAGDEPDVVTDIGVTHNVQGPDPQLDALLRLAPGVALRAVGLGAICQAWGGLLTGLPTDHRTARRTYAAANQGAMMFAFRLSLFADPAQYKAQIDEYVRTARTLEPLAGTEGAHLPGDVEESREKRLRQTGIPLGEEHEQALREVAELLAVPLPWPTDRASD